MPVIIKNILTLNAIYIARLALPLMLLPMLTRRLSPDGYGIYMYAMAVSMWLTVLIEYGFNVHSTRAISAGGESGRVTVVVGTQSARLLLSLAALPVCVLLGSLLKIFQGNEYWAFVAWLVGFAGALVPVFYFQAKEALRTVAITEFIAGVFLLVLTYGLVRGDADLPVLALIVASTRIGVTAYLTYAMLTDLPGRRPTLFDPTAGLRYLRDGFQLFLFQAVVSFYTSFNAVFLGFFRPPAEVGQYTSAERLIRAALTLMVQASLAIFPRLTKLKSEDAAAMGRLRSISLGAIFGVGCMGLAATLLLSEPVSRLLFPAQAAHVAELLNILCFLFPAVALSNVLGFLYMLVDRSDRLLSTIMMAVAAVNVVAAYQLIQARGAIGMAIGWVAIEWLAAIALTVTVYFTKSRRQGSTGD